MSSLSMSRGGPLMPAQSPTRTNSRATITANSNSTAPRPLRRSGSNNTATLHISNGSQQDDPTATGHRYSSHYFPGEESIVLQYPNQWHDDDDEEQQLSAAIDPFPRFPPPPCYPPPNKAAAAAKASQAATGSHSGVTGTHRSALCRTIDNTIGRVDGGADRSHGRGPTLSGSGGNATTKIGRHNGSGECRNGGGGANNGHGTTDCVTLNRKVLGAPEPHPDAIDTTSCRIMAATNVINSKTMGKVFSGSGRSGSASRQHYGHNTMGGGFTQRHRQQQQHRHSADLGNDEGEEEDAEEDDDDEGDCPGDVDFNGADVDEDCEDNNGGGGVDRSRRRRGRTNRTAEDGGGCGGGARTGSNKLFSGNGSSRAVIREASQVECRPSNSQGKQQQTQQRSHSGQHTAKRSSSSSNNHSNGNQANGHGGGHSNGDAQVRGLLL